MQPDPFGNLKDWGPVLELIYKLADDGNLQECQPGLTRILRYRDNWKLREETLNRIGKISRPDDDLIRQVMNISADENLYYEVRILACETMMEFLKNSANDFNTEIKAEIVRTVEDLLGSQQPPIFEPALRKLYSVVRERFRIV
ncbi:MAG: hypothetical protein OEL83_14360 [Desulforhopalus sp.]|nr:hypothetical protein [Desulforhopalus sp.]